jgi:hypothetical protein
MKKNSKSFFIAIATLVVVAASSCNKGENPEVYNFKLLTNINYTKGDTLEMEMDLSNAIMEGVIIPSKELTSNGYFNFSFSVISANEPLFYKIYYQNETYKFSEGKRSLDHENFYGSWEEVEHTFKPVPLNPNKGFTTVVDSFRIVGNPRNERIYFGKPMEEYKSCEIEINENIVRIKNEPEWYRSVVEKAKNGHREVEEQLFLDALWAYNFDRQQGNENNRWKRNPRAGVYRFMLVVATEKALSHLPEGVKDISKTEESNNFVNPFSYFLLGKGARQRGIKTLVATTHLKIHAKFDLGAGIYADILTAKNLGYDKSFFNDQCNDSWDLFKRAHFSQFFHFINKNYRLTNVPLIADVINDQYDKELYFKNKDLLGEDQLRLDYPVNSECPCKTVSSNSENGTIELRNPGNTSIENAKKEQVGIIGRVGFTYGKFTAKIKFPQLINSTNVWNGLTNAFWLLYQDESEWNIRRSCSVEGYIPKDKVGPDNIRVAKLNYSEIDIEIVKVSKFWPQTSYPPGNPFPQEDASMSDEVIIACTNWDMACPEPKKFAWGVFDVPYSDTTFVFHRWNPDYHAVTSKYAIKQQEVVLNDYFYYQIDWQPDRITWRVGPEKDKLRVIASIDNRHTSIPNNQMVVLFSQEFHYTAWWPLMPFEQDYIPYPKNDIVGTILEITIE